MRARKSISRRLVSLLCPAAALLAGAVAPAAAQTASYSVSSWQYNGYDGGQVGDSTLGYNFTPTQNITVTSLGEWVPTGHTINLSEDVGMFNSNGDLLFSSTWNQANATISGNTVGQGEFRYVDVTGISPASRVLLANQTYTVAGSVGNNSYATSGVDLASAPDVTITSGGLASNGNTVGSGTPTPPSSPSGYNMYGTNFQYVTGGVAATPEPGAWALFGGLATCGAGFLRRRKR